MPAAKCKSARPTYDRVRSLVGHRSVTGFTKSLYWYWYALYYWSVTHLARGGDESALHQHWRCSE